MTCGAIVIELHVPDRNGKLSDVVLGFDDLAGYLGQRPYFGAVVGRVANRIARGRFKLDENLKKRKDVSIIIIAHNLAHVLSVVGRLVILSRGRVIAEREQKETSIEDVTEIITRGAA